MSTEPDVTATRVEDGVPDTSGAPVIDIVGHLRELRHAVLPALVVAVLIGVLVGVVRSFMPATYERVGTARFSMSSDSTSETFAKAAATQFESLGTDAEVLGAVARDVGLGSADDIAGRVTVKASLAPGQVDVTATAPSPDEAEKLVTSTITELDRVATKRTDGGADSDRAASLAAQVSELDARIRSATGGDPKAVADLYQQRQALAEQQRATAGNVPVRLTVLSLQYSDGSQASPNPLPEGAVAALIAFVLAAEGIVLYNSRSGRKVSPAWARRTGRTLGIDVDTAIVEGDALPVPTEIHVKKLRDGGATVVLLDDRPAAVDRADVDPDAAPGDGGRRKSAADTGAKRGQGSAKVAPAAEAEPVTDVAPAAEAEPATTAEPASGTPSAPATPIDEIVPPSRDRFALSDEWWRMTDLAAVDLAVVVCEESSTSKAAVLDCLDTLAVANVPTRLVVRESPDFSGPFAWLKI